MVKYCRDQARDELWLMMGGGAAVGVAGGAGAVAGAIIAMGGGQLLFRMGGTIAGFIPGIGQIVQPTIGAGAVKAFGEAAIAYFENMYPDKIYRSD